MKFWDASAIVPLIAWQEKTEPMRALLDEDTVMCVWWTTPVECLSAVSRLRREGALNEEQVEKAARHLADLTEAWNEVEPTTRVRNTAMRLLRVHPLRAADACQLAAAIAACNGNPQDLPFVCLDDRLREAGRKEGFLVL